MFKTKKLVFSVIFITVAGQSCQKPKDKEEKTVANQPLPAQTAPVNNPTPFATIAPGKLTISVNGSSTPALYVKLNTPVIWQMTAVMADGTPATITTISTASNRPTPSGMVISGSQVSFTPKTVDELNGSIVVTAAKLSETPVQQTFYWVPDPAGATTATCSQELLTQALMAFTQGKFTMANIPSIYLACAQNLQDLFKNL